MEGHEEILRETEHPDFKTDTPQRPLDPIL